MPSLVLEGGTFRPIFSAGVMDALLDNDIMFPYCIGVSAGITNGFSYISKQKRRNLDVLETYRNDKRYLGVRNFFTDKSLFGLNFVYDELPNKLNVFDKETFNLYDGTLLVGVTNAETGKEEYLNGKDIDDKCTMLRATCAIPLFFPVIKVNDKFYYDGGIAEPIAINKAIEDGNEKHLIILTQPKGFVKEFSKKNAFCAKVIGRNFPKMKEPILNRHNHYNELVKKCEQLEADGKAIILRPDFSINSFEKDVTKLRAAYEHGYNMASEKIHDIKALFD